MAPLFDFNRIIQKKNGGYFPSFFFLTFVFWILGCSFLSAVELDPYPGDEFSRDPFAISFFREERPSFYWVNAGVPDVFFNGVSQVSVSPTVYDVRTMQYGVKTSGWLTDQFQLRATVPFEANALLDANGNTRNVANFGDIEIAATYLLAGKREKGNFFAVDGSYRFATGTNPFQLAFPLLSTGKGAPTESIGLELGQELGGFSFFQSIHYEKTQPIALDASNPYFGAGVFQWPDQVNALGRVDLLVFHRAHRAVSLFYEFRARITGLMEFNKQVITYDQGQTTDQLFFSTSGLDVRVDKEFSAQGSVTFFPFDLPNYRPDLGWLFSLSMVFRPI